MTLGFLATAPVFAQAVSQISGTATDQTGAAVPGVEVTATQTETGLKRTVTTDETGNYVLTNLPIGPYRLEAMKQGFRTFAQTGIQLQVATSPTIPITLAVGEVSQTVEVEANAGGVETQRLSVGQVVENQRILELPLNGRDSASLINIAPAAVQTATSPTWAMKTGVYFSVAGGQTYGVYYSLDGAPHINVYDATGLPVPFPDALQEFKVETSTQNATNGTRSGASVSSVTKSGTNAFHGDAFEFLRNGAMNARNFFAVKTDTLKRSQFGGTIGGPIKKDKLFFFVGYQGTTLRQAPLDATTFIPTAAMLGGDFRTFASAQCQGTNRTLGAPFGTNGQAANTVAPSQLNQSALRIAAKFPTTSDPCGRIVTGNPVSEYQYQLPVRVDYQMSDKQTLFARYITTVIDTKLPYDISKSVLSTASLGGINASGGVDRAQSLIIGDTYLFSGSVVNSFRASANRVVQDRPGAKFFGPKDVGINAFSYTPEYFVMSVTGGASIGGGTSADLSAYITYWTLNDDVSWVKGAHQFAFGTTFTQALVNNNFNVRSPGNYNFNGQITGLGMGDFLTGQMSSFRQGGPNPLIVYQRFLGFYGQDTWKVNSRLTFNYGLRWEPFFPQQVKNANIYAFSVDGFNRNQISSIYTNAPAGFTYPGDRGFNGNASILKQWTNFQPRIGLAWDPFGDGKTAVRAGAGIAYDFVGMQLHHNTVCFAPFCGDTTVNGPIPLDNPWRDYPVLADGTRSPYPSCCPGKPPSGIYPIGSTYMPIPSQIRTPQVYNWNVGIQRQVNPNLLVTAAYLGNHAIRMWTLTELNPGVFLGTGPCTLQSPGQATPTREFNDCSTTGSLNLRRRLNLQDPARAQNISNLTAYDSGATQMYHGLLFTAQWRAAKNLNVNGNYTWSHCIGDTTVGNTVPNPGANYYNQQNRYADRGACVGDRRHLFNLTVVGQTPRFSNNAARLIGTGWTMSGIYRFQSGSPLTIVTGVDRDTTGTSTTIQRPNQILQDVNATNQGDSCSIVNCVTWLNSAAFAQPAFGSKGNIGASNVLGPRYWQFDMALSREFRVGEGRRFELRGEAFNIFNGVRYGNPGVNLNTSASFGRITSAQDPRILQVAAKFVF
ncbi:MAG: carboxypeptidase regulatory-like domain-containing protein [Bryobacteraceae bacterium]